MNLHLPRSAASKFETEDILNVKKQFINPQSNKPCMGSVMDASLGSKLITTDGVWLTKDQVFSLMSYIPNFSGQLPNPEDKENKLWSGRQVFSMILPKVNYYERGDDGEIATLIEKGKFIKGTVSKRMIGTGSRGLIQIIFNDYGPDATRDFLSNLQVLTCHWLKTVGFSVGISDVIPDVITNKKIQDIINKTKDEVMSIINDTENTFHLDSPEIVQSDFENKMISKLNLTRDVAGGSASKNLPDKNSIKKMVSISKGSFINISQIMATVGQQAVSNNKSTGRVPDSFEDRPLPHFTKYDFTPECRGFVSNSYYTGLNAAEFFYHMMSGRQGLIDTACKSVTRDTSLIIIENNTPRQVDIGDWIDEYLDKNQKDIVYHDETEANMELLDIEKEKVFIPTTTNSGKMSWQQVTKVTRHDPSEFIYHIKTKYGRDVKVVESKSLLIWNGNEYEPKDMKEINIGDKVPVCRKLPNSAYPAELESSYLEKLEREEGTYMYITTSVEKRNRALMELNSLGYVGKLKNNTIYVDKEEKYEEVEDTILDEIVSIEKISSDEYPKVYDITVPSTKNFGLANGLQVYDTSETGYLQRQLVKMLEDMIVQYDHTTRNESSDVVQHLYGGDGLDPCSIERQPIPRYLTDMDVFEKTFQYIVDGKLKNKKEYNKLLELKKIFQERYHYLEGVFLPINLPRMIKNYTSRVKKSMRKCDMSYMTVYNIINDFCDEIDIYPNRNNAILNDINYNATMMMRIMLHMEFAYNRVMKHGICEALLIKMLDDIKERFYASLMQPGAAAGIITAQSLGEPCTQLSVVYDTKVIVKRKDYSKSVKIGKYIDDLMERYKKDRITTHITESGESHILNIPKEWNITVPSLSKKEKVEWKRLTQISRHPPNGQLVEIKTRSGRYITTTLSHSFVTRKDNKIVQVRGDELKIGDFLPVIKKLEGENILTEIEDFELDEVFGNFIGQILSDSHVSKNGYNIEICNTEYSFIEKAKKFCKIYNYSTKEKSETSDRGFKSNKRVYTLSIKSKTLNSLCKEWCGIDGKIDAFNKKIPEWTINSPKVFLKGLLSTYFDGDGNISINPNKKMNRCIRSHSSSRELLEGIEILLTRFGIFSTIKISRNKPNILYELNILTKHIPKFDKYIGFGIDYKQNTLKEIMKIKKKDNYNGLDRIPGIADIFTRIGKKLQMLHYINRFTKKGSIGRDTMAKYIKIFEDKNNPDVKDDLKILKRAYYGNVLWDTITSVKYIDTDDVYVYDFSVEENETFSTNDGLIVHNTLNSVDYLEKICVHNDENNFVGMIGEFIDNEIKNADKSKVQYLENDTTYVDIKNKNLKIVSVDENGCSHLKLIEAVTRHLPGKDGMLLKVTTKSGRSVRATKAKSFVIIKDNKLVPVTGDEIKVGDYIPIIKDYPIKEPPRTLKYVLNESIRGQEDFEHKSIKEVIFESPAYLQGYISELFQGEMSKEFDKDICDEVMELISIAGYFSTISGNVITRTDNLENKTLENIYYDEIISIENIKSSHTYVYDFTIEDTKIFNLLGGFTCFDTFHSAGVASKTQITSGVPRIKEIITLSKSPKTPSMTIFFKNNSRDEVDILKNKLEYTCLSSLLVQSKIYFDPDIANSNIEEDAAWLKEDYELYNEDYEDTDDYSMYVIRMEISSYELFERSLSVEYIYNQIMDAHEKRNLQIMFTDENAKHIYMYIRVGKANTTLKEIKILENLLLQTRICGIDGITRTFLRKETLEEFENGTLVNKDYYVVDTEGGNLEAVLGLPYVDETRTYSNNVNEMMEVFGVFSFARSLEIETESVMKSSGIFINKKHIEMLSRTMSCKGVGLPMNRHGSKKSNRGPFSCASFEETNDRLTKAAIHNEGDNLLGVSSNIILGQIAPCGTGKCELAMDMDKLE